jgi:hypothetical protein
MRIDAVWRPANKISVASMIRPRGTTKGEIS